MYIHISSPKGQKTDSQRAELETWLKCTGTQNGTAVHGLELPSVTREPILAEAGREGTDQANHNL